MGLHLLLHVEETGERERETNKSMWGKRTDEREKINKIVIYTSTVTVQICMVTVANFLKTPWPRQTNLPNTALQLKYHIMKNLGTIPI